MEGSDQVIGSGGHDELYGGRADGESAAGQDTVTGRDGDDAVVGGTGADDLQGGNGKDTIFQGPEGDTAADTIDGGDGDDLIFAGSGEGGTDTISCGAGVDTVEVDASDQVDANCETVIQWDNAPPTDDGGDRDVLINYTNTGIPCSRLGQTRYLHDLQAELVGGQALNVLASLSAGHQVSSRVRGALAPHPLVRR